MIIYLSTFELKMPDFTRHVAGSAVVAWWQMTAAVDIDPMSMYILIDRSVGDSHTHTTLLQFPGTLQECHTQRCVILYITLYYIIWHYITHRCSHLTFAVSLVRQTMTDGKQVSVKSYGTVGSCLLVCKGMSDFFFHNELKECVADDPFDFLGFQFSQVCSIQVPVTAAPVSKNFASKMGKDDQGLLEFIFIFCLGVSSNFGFNTEKSQWHCLRRTF